MADLSAIRLYGATLADRAFSRGCYGMWGGVDDLDNAAAVAVYRAAGAEEPERVLLFSWSFAQRR